MQRTTPTPEELARLRDLLEQLAGQRELLDEIDEAERLRLLQAAGALVRPSRDALKAAVRARRRAPKDRQRSHDAAIVARTGMRTALRQSVYVAPAELPADGEAPAARLVEPRACYVCKEDYTEV